MLKLGSTYLITKNFEKSINFFELLLSMKVSSRNFDRWAQFNFGNSCFALYNPQYDERQIAKNAELKEKYSKEYLEYLTNRSIKFGNNIVLNFSVKYLRQEHSRIQSLGIGKPSEIMLINVKSPYYLFLLDDPDGNIIEITGKYEPETKK